MESLGEFDYIVVGAGSAGCVMAARLSEDPATRVLLLEAGPPDDRREIQVPVAFSKLFHSEVDWDYRTEPQPGLNGRTVYWPRGKTLGGSSSTNAMIYMRGHPADYDGWEKLGNEGWSWDEVLPYFKRSEHNERGADAFHGTGGPLNVSDLRHVHPVVRAIVESGKQMGWPENNDANGATQEGIGVNQVTMKGGKRWSAASAYLKPAMNRANLVVRTRARTERLTFDGRRATGVQFMEGGAYPFSATARREVILCGGAINSPQLLMLSGVGPAAHLKEVGIDVLLDLPGVGQNLQDHLATSVTHLLKEPISMLNASKPRHLVQWLTRGTGMLASNVAEGNGFIRTRPELPAPDLQFVFAAVIYNPEEGEATEHGFAIGPILLQPRSVGEVRLKSKHPTVRAEIDPRYLSDPDGEDLATLLEGVKLARRLARGTPLDPYRGDEIAPGAGVDSDEALKEHVRERSATLYHPVGTCRMGADGMAVVDEQLRVHGLEGLRVVDASVMPVVPRGNTNAPTIMVAEKAADLIRGRVTA